MGTVKPSEPTFLDSAMVGLGSPRLRAFYEQMERVIDWGSLAAMVAALPEYQPSPQGGRPSISPLLMLKATMVNAATTATSAGVVVAEAATGGRWFERRRAR